MSKNWAICIGINSYENLTNLKWARQDAEAVRDRFIELNFEQVYYFGDDKPTVSSNKLESKSNPSYATVRRFLRERFSQSCLEAGDNLWFFFSGHGVRYNQENYLLPADADLENVEGTALSLKNLTSQLLRSGADNVIMILDACRSGYQGDNDQVKFEDNLHPGVVTFLSCSPSETSYEVERLRHGTFTHALLNALKLKGQRNCSTIESLNQYLCNSVPTLNRRYGKPIQTPYALVATTQKYQMILLMGLATTEDTNVSKTAALEAEMAGDVNLAEQLWRRVLAVSPVDQQAIQSLQRLVNLESSSEVTSEISAFLPLPSALKKSATDEDSSDSEVIKSNIQLELTLDREFDKFNAEELELFLDALAEAANVDRSDFQFISKTRGSVNLKLSMPSEIAEKLFWAAKRGELAELDVTDANLVCQSIAASILAEKTKNGKFDVFLCHNSKDKSEVKTVGEKLKEYGIYPWLDEWELRPGLPWQRVLEEQIGYIGSAAVFIGNDGVGPWQDMELNSFIRQFVKRGCPVIPVILNSCAEDFRLPPFLEGMGWVSFKEKNSEPIKKLVWGITGKRL